MLLPSIMPAACSEADAFAELHPDGHRALFLQVLGSPRQETGIDAGIRETTVSCLITKLLMLRRTPDLRAPIRCWVLLCMPPVISLATSTSSPLASKTLQRSNQTCLPIFHAVYYSTEAPCSTWPRIRD